METANNLGEREIIETIRKQLSIEPNMPVPFGDDVSAIRQKNGNIAVLKSDMLVGKTDIPPQMSYWQAARKAIVMNISDLAAKGIEPLGLLVSLGIPRSITKRSIVQIGKGLNAGAKEYGTSIIGGDTNETQDLIISIAAFGTTKKDVTLRRGAHPGDILATTGLFGLTLPGLKILKEKLSAPLEMRKKFIDAVLMPRARLQEGLALAKTGATTATIDSSDGLAWSLHEISRASNIGFLIDCPPFAQETFEFAKMHNLDPLKLCLYGGEEYELIVTIEPDEWRRAQEAVFSKGGKLLKIGKATVKQAIHLRHDSRMIDIEAKGYEHFKHKR